MTILLERWVVRLQEKVSEEWQRCPGACSLSDVTPSRVVSLA